MKNIIVSLGLLIFVYSCNDGNIQNDNIVNLDNAKYDIYAMNIDYFITNSVRIDSVDNKIIVWIDESKLIDNKKKKLGDKWVNAEAYVSVIATQLSIHIKGSIDSFVYKLTINGDKEIYSYNISELHKANMFIGICKKFADAINKNDYELAKSFIANNIKQELNTQELDNLLVSTFGGGQIVGTELIGTKIVDNVYSFYINFSFSSQEVQTIIFSFLSEDNKIAGIRIP